MPTLRQRRTALVGAVFLAVAGSVDGAALRFNRDIRPILSDHCFRCHGPDEAKRQAKLRLDVRDSAVLRAAIVPGQPEESGLIRRVMSEDPEEVMPPPSTHKELDPEATAKLRQWIAEGAVYERHWAYEPVRRPAVPSRFLPSGGVGNPVDAFVREGLVEVGLEAAPEADRSTLLRRLSLDLTGLPPSPSEVDAFRRDDEPRAYERQVERLLASPHYGERMAVPWLDAVRFADTVGYHGDQNQRIFPYRDYVIGAFNANQPFDQFTLEQIAGDLLPNPTTEQRVATGFNRLNMMTREGGAQPKEYLAKYQADRVRTVSTAWLGSTMACAECHDHKYDPFTMRDFYAMAAFFADLQQWGVYQDYNYTPNPDLRGWSNDHPFPPEIEVASPYLQRRLARFLEEEQRILSEVPGLMRTNAAARDAFRRWRNEVRDFLDQHGDGWRFPGVAAVEAKSGAAFVPRDGGQEPDASIHLPGKDPGHDRIALAMEAGWLAALRLELLPRTPGQAAFRGDRRQSTVRLTANLRRAGSGNDEPVEFAFAEADAAEPRYANGREIPGVAGGWRTAERRAFERQTAIYTVAQPRRMEEGDTLILHFPNNVVGRLRLAVSPVAPVRSGWVEMLGDLRAALDRNAGLWEPAAHAAFLRSTAWDAATLGRLRRVDEAIRECRGGRAWTLVTVATNRMVTRLLPRGNWMDESGAVVQPATPGFLPAVDGPPDRELTRLDLARWLVAKENPLTARHFANRLWAQFFGAGISGRIEDLGLQGEWPTHPDLLDWLAAEFMEPGAPASPVPTASSPRPWDVKHLVRLLVNSATYRQSSVPSARAREVDPANRWLSRQSPRRLEAEFIRDQALASAGLLQGEIGGPSVFPYQPPGYYANLQFPDRDYVPDQDERQYRRGVYMHWQRTFLHPMLANFDAPSREECGVARLPSNTPQQALTLLNDPTFVEAARVLAERLVGAPVTDEARLREMFERVLARPPTRAEQASLLRRLVALRELYAGRPEDARALAGVGHARVPMELSLVELAAWTNLTRVVLNLHETITVY